MIKAIVCDIQTKKFVVYKCTNLINGKVYIGKTYDYRDRISKHHYVAFNKNDDSYFCKALRKYKQENFKWNILSQVDTEEEVFELEKFWIKYFKSNNKKFGYNLTNGGEGATGYKFTQEDKNKLSKIKKITYLDYEKFINLMQKYKIDSKRNYYVKYKDIMKLEGVILPANANLEYKKSWKDLLFIYKKISLDEFRFILIKYNIKSRRQYQKIMWDLMNKENVLLYFKANVYYKKTWYEIFNKTKKDCIKQAANSHKREFVSYYILKELVIKYNIRSSIFYKKEYKNIMEKEKVLIPSNPHKIYKEWKNWNIFLEKSDKYKNIDYKISIF